MEEVNVFLDEAKQQMEKAVSYTANQFAKIRAGKANPAMLDGIMVDYYGNPTPLNQVATINTPDPKSILVKPYEKTMVAEVEKAIQASDLGITPQNDGEIIRLNIPSLTEERRKDLVKQAKQEAESGKVSIRNIRKDINDSIKKLKNDGVSEDDVKRGEEEVQKITDTHIAKVDDYFSIKEKELLTI